MFIDTPLDLMYVVLSVSIAVFTIFLCAVMYYVIQILKQGNDVLTDIREKIDAFENAVESIKERVVSSATSMSFIAKHIGTVVDVVKKRRGSDDEDDWEEEDEPKKKKRK